MQNDNTEIGYNLAFIINSYVFFFIIAADIQFVSYLSMCVYEVFIEQLKNRKILII